MAVCLPRLPATPVRTTTERLVIPTLIRPGTPTLRMSANSSHLRATPRNARVTSDRPDRRYQINTRLPAPNDVTRPQPAPAGPSGGNGPTPKISIGDRMTCPITLP